MPSRLARLGIPLALLGLVPLAPAPVAAQVYLIQWGALGSGDGQFNAPAEAAVDAAGNVYVADTFNQCIQKFGPVSTPATETSWGRLKRLYR